MILIQTLLILFSWSYTVEKKTALNENTGAYQNYTELRCAKEETQYCRYACGNDYQCEIPERLCNNCFSQNSMFFRILFTKLHDNFEVVQNVWKTGDHLVYLADENYILIDNESIYNFYTTWGREDVIEDFAQLCPAQEVSPILMVALNEEQKPKDIVGVICRHEQGFSYALDVQSKFQQDIILDSQH